MFVAVEGPTGVGKTTLAARLAIALDSIAVFDPFNENPFLPRLLTAGSADEPLALRVELTFLALRVAQLREVERMLSLGHDVVADWALLKQPIFAASTLSPEDAARVAATVATWADSVPHPDVLIGMSAATAIIRQRVFQRGRHMESNLTDAEIDALSAAFETAYESWDASLIRIDATTFDTLTDHDIDELAAWVRQLSIRRETR